MLLVDYPDEISNVTTAFLKLVFTFLVTVFGGKVNFIDS